MTYRLDIHVDVSRPGQRKRRHMSDEESRKRWEAGVQREARNICLRNGHYWEPAWPSDPRFKRCDCCGEVRRTDVLGRDKPERTLPAHIAL